MKKKNTARCQVKLLTLKLIMSDIQVLRKLFLTEVANKLSFFAPFSQKKKCNPLYIPFVQAILHAIRALKIEEGTHLRERSNKICPHYMILKSVVTFSY